MKRREVLKSAGIVTAAALTGPLLPRAAGARRQGRAGGRELGRHVGQEPAREYVPALREGDRL